MSRRRRGREAGQADVLRADLNLVPMIDVMLVLLVIVMIASPWLTHAVRVELPHASSSPTRYVPAHVDIDIDAAGALFWQGEAVAADDLAPLLADATRRDPELELRIHADRRTAYAHVAGAMAVAARQGVARIGFVSDPGR